MAKQSLAESVLQIGVVISNLQVRLDANLTENVGGSISKSSKQHSKQHEYGNQVNKLSVTNAQMNAVSR